MTLQTQEAPAKAPPVKHESAAEKVARDPLGDYRRQLLAAAQQAPKWYTLSPTAKRVAAHIIKRHANPKLDGAMFPSQSKLAGYFPTARKGAKASKTGTLSRQTVCKALGELVEKDIFEKPARGPGGVNLYRVHPDLLSKPATVIASGDNGQGTGIDSRIDTGIDTEATRGSSPPESKEAGREVEAACGAESSKRQDVMEEVAGSESATSERDTSIASTTRLPCLQEPPEQRAAEAWLAERDAEGFPIREPQRSDVRAALVENFERVVWVWGHAEERIREHGGYRVGLFLTMLRDGDRPPEKLCDFCRKPGEIRDRQAEIPWPGTILCCASCAERFRDQQAAIHADDEAKRLRHEERARFHAEHGHYPGEPKW